jgi:NAD(P)-dependent dehydrogenase (short-subunit alcohol dehydrogenase family)
VAGDDLRFDGRVAIVTGAGGGLGREYAHLLAARGARVVVNDYGGNTRGTEPSPERAHEVAAEITAAGGEAVANTDTVSTPEGGRSIVQTALDAYGTVDVVVHNAGIAGGAPHFDELDDESIRRMFDTHLLGAFHVLRPAWRTMRERGYGRIVNISSGSVFGVYGTWDYPSAKAGLIGLTRNLAVSGAASGIKVNAVMPVAYTRLTAQVPSDTFKKWLHENFQPDRVAPLVALLAHDECPSSGEVFTAGGNRAARVLLSVVPGYQSSGPLTPEELRDHWDAVVDASKTVIPSDAMDELRLYQGPSAWQSATRIAMGNEPYSED